MYICVYICESVSPKQLKLIHNQLWCLSVPLIILSSVYIISLGFYYTVRTIEMWKVEMQHLFYSEQNFRKSPQKTGIQHKLNLLSPLHVLLCEYSEFECGRAACPHDIMLSAVSVTFYHGQENITVFPFSHSHLPPPPFTCNHFLFTTSTTHTYYVLTFVL